MNALVPDRAMVPSASTISSRLMPTPLSSTVSRRFSASIRSVRQGFGSPPSRAGLAIASKRSLAGIGGVGDQLAQENVPIRVDRVHHALKQLGDIGLETAALRGDGVG